MSPYSWFTEDRLKTQMILRKRERERDLREYLYVKWENINELLMKLWIARTQAKVSRDVCFMVQRSLDGLWANNEGVIPVR